MDHSRALVIFSGGQDSTTCLLWAQRNFKQVEAISFDYGQRHSIERECAKNIADKLSIKRVEIDLTFFRTLSENSMMTKSDIALTGGFNNLPTTFVIGRNAVFLTVAISWGLARGYENFVFGACQMDYSGYPDCRQQFIDSQERTLSLATNSNVKIHTPLMNLTKGETFAMAQEFGGLDLVVADTHTCYKGERLTLHEWGYGCSTCPACLLRMKGFNEFKELSHASR